ncbi:hypothetical protein YPPY54_0188, partial [Yersinia pestis PY-54]
MYEAISCCETGTLEIE